MFDTNLAAPVNVDKPELTSTSKAVPVVSASTSKSAVAEAFAQLLGRGDEVRDANGWVWRAAFKIAAGELKRDRQFVAEVIERGVTDPEPPWQLVDALKRLSEQQRAIVVLRDYVGHSGRVTADILGSTEKSVRVQLFRARKILRKVLEP